MSIQRPATRKTRVEQVATSTPAQPAGRPAAAASVPAQATRVDTFQAGPAGGVVRGGNAASRATLKFGAGWEESAAGPLKAGGKLQLEYDPARAQQRHTHNGFPAWGVTAFVKFLPSGEVVERPAVEFESFHGRPSNNARPAQVSVDIPADARAVEVWFRNWTGADSPRESWDSDFGNNYRFAVEP